MKNILIQLKIFWINTKLNIKKLIVICIANILYVFVMTGGIFLYYLSTIISAMTDLVKYHKDNNTKEKWIAKINKHKINHAILLEQHTTLINALKSRLSQDCFIFEKTKRLIARICATINRIRENSNFKFSRDIIPLIVLILGKLYFLGIIYITILDLINLYS